jgi:hypothetical protein
LLDELVSPLDLETYEQLAHGLGAPGMRDVSRMPIGSACPRCVARRIYAVDENKNLWLCIANAMPVPWRHDQVTEHDAAEFTQDPQVTDGR